MSPYYRGPMPTTDEERAAMRTQALRKLRSLKGIWKQTEQTSRHGSDVLLSVAHQQLFNESVHKLMISTEEHNPGWYYDTARPIPKNKRQGRLYDGVPISSLLKKVDIVLRKFDTEQ